MIPYSGINQYMLESNRISRSNGHDLTLANSSYYNSGFQTEKWSYCTTQKRSTWMPLNVEDASYAFSYGGRLVAQRVHCGLVNFNKAYRRRT